MRSRQPDPAWLAAQYNNRDRVPEHALIFRQWAESSARARREALCTLDVRYDEGEGGTLDVFPARSGPNGQAAPVIVFIHGGYWRSLDKSDFSFVAPAFAAAGAMVVVPNYGLCPKVSMESIALQMARAVLWCVQHAAAHGGDPARISVVGHSAGGHLAAMLLSCRWKELGFDAPKPPMQGALSISGLFDLEPLRQLPAMQADLQLTPQSVARLSPAFFPRPKGAKLYATVGQDESEEFVRQNRLIRDVWGPTAVPVCEAVPGKNHFNVLDSLVDPQGRLHELALRLAGLR
jgi:arylformamidase